MLSARMETAKAIAAERCAIGMRLLIIEDDAALCDALRLHLSRDGYDVDACLNGADAAYYIKNGAYGLIVLDRMLPGVDGLTLLKRLRSGGNATPVLMLTAMDAVADRTDGLDAGADDYLVKPFAMPELLSRVRALLRRPALLPEQGVLTFGELTLNVKGHTLARNDQTVSLSGKETALLELLFENAEKALPRQQILARVWGGDEAVENGNVDNYVYFIRRRLKALGARACVKAVHGVGYMLVREAQ